MPVVVTGAGGAVARVLIPVLVTRSPEVRAVVRRREQAEGLRALGAKVAVTELSDIETLGLAMDAAHTVCHLAGGIDLPDEAASEEANAQTTRWVLEAALGAGVKRFLLLSCPGASPGASNVYLRSKGMAEEAVRASGIEHVIVRSTHIVAPGSDWLRAMAAAASGRIAVVVGTGTQRLAPVLVDDVAAVLAAADDRATAVAGTFGLQGPDEATADELADLLTGRPRRKVHLSPRAASRVPRLLGGRWSSTLLEALAADSLADAPDAAAEFSIATRPVGERLGRPFGGG